MRYIVNWIVLYITYSYHPSTFLNLSLIQNKDMKQWKEYSEKILKKIKRYIMVDTKVCNCKGETKTDTIVNAINIVKMGTAPGYDRIYSKWLKETDASLPNCCTPSLMNIGDPPVYYVVDTYLVYTYLCVGTLTYPYKWLILMEIKKLVHRA